MRVRDIVPYENNPRKNDKAVKTVKESIEQCGYCNPIIVDENNVVLAGHTRLKALKQLKWDEADVIVRKDLSEEQKKAFRLLDNKTSEFSDWDSEKLVMEMEGLDFGNMELDWGIKMDLSIDEGDEEEEESYKYVCPECGYRFN